MNNHISITMLVKNIYTLTITTIGLIGCVHSSTSCADTGNKAISFEQYEVVTSSVERQTVLSGYFLSNATAELAIIYIDENDHRRLNIYTFVDDKWDLNLKATLHPNVQFIDVVNIGGLDRLITYEDGSLNWFNPESETEQVLVKVTSNFNPPRKNEIPHVDLTHDLNNDNLDDLVVPDLDGFRIFIQLRDGTFSESIKIGYFTDMSGIYGTDGYRYNPWSQSRVYEMDYNQDGSIDLVFWNKDHFEVHVQNENTLFTSVPNTFTTDVVFDSDDFYSLASGKMTGRVLYTLSDLNGDEITDLVVYSLDGNRITNKQSKYEVHFGVKTSNRGTSFTSDVGITFQSENKIQLRLESKDFDGDGKFELLLTSIDRKFLKGSIWKSIKGFMGDDIWLNLEFYQMENGFFPSKPKVVHRIALDGVPSHREPGWVPLDIVLRGGMHEIQKHNTLLPRAFNRTLLIGDVTGDGRSDLLIEPEFRELNVFVGVQGSNIFASQPQKVPVILPYDGEYTWLVDLNQDGKQDILMHHPFSLRDIHGGRIEPLGTEPHRIILFIAR